MSWIHRYRCRAFLRNSLGAVPVACFAAALLIAPLVRSLDDRTRWTLLNFGVDGSRAVIGALSAAILTFIVFAFSIILLAVQVAGGQLSPRIIARVIESRVASLTLGSFSFSFAYSLAVLGRIEDRVPQLCVLLAILVSLISVVLFVSLIQAMGLSLRPGVILARVAADTRITIQAAYPATFAASAGPSLPADLMSLKAAGTVQFNGRPGMVLALDVPGLAKIAGQTGCILELIPRLGDFLAPGEDLCRVYAARPGTGLAVDGAALHRCIALGPEQSVDDDPVFGLRILVEIACKALSPAINDPTTGVLAIHQIEHLLRLLGSRQLNTGAVRDSAGNLRVIFRTPSWEDYVSLAVTEIRLFGATDPQLPRRLRAMLEGLMETLPGERAIALQNELVLLQSTVDRTYADPTDQAIASAGDCQGFGSRVPEAGTARLKQIRILPETSQDQERRT